MTIKYRDHTKTYITVQFIVTFDCVLFQNKSGYQYLQNALQESHQQVHVINIL